MRARLFQVGIGEFRDGFNTMNLPVQLHACLLESHCPDHHLFSSATEFPLLVGFFDGIAAVWAKCDEENFRRPMVGERARIERAGVSMEDVARVPPEKM